MLLTQVEFKSNIVGKIRNTSLPAKDFLLPLYEAVVNSIQSIAQSKRKDGKIKITVYREALLAGQDSRVVPNITGFDIWDNGEGFTDPNLESFITADSIYKEKIGGKGLGRFVWLKAFDTVSIESHYKSGPVFKYRGFDFVPHKPGIANPIEKNSQEKDSSTTIHLRGFLQPYVRRSCKNSTLAILMVSYCFDYLSSDDCPEILLVDEATLETLNIKNFFEKEVMISAAEDSFDINKEKFDVKHVLLKSTHIQQHKVCYCADKRVVCEDKLDSNSIPDMEKELEVESQKAAYVVYVYSQFLDRAANTERTALNILEDFEASDDEITWKKIRQGVIGNAKKFLSPYLATANISKKEAIERYINEEGLEYSPLKTQLNIETISIDVAKHPKKLDLELHRRRQELELDARKEGKEILQYVPNENEEEYASRLGGYFKKIETLNSSALAKYVCSRKAILEIFEGLLKLQANNKYPLEKAIHNLIFSMGKDSGTMDRENNLWIIDERLPFQNYVASDKKYNSMQVDTGGNLEPDIAVFHNAYAYSEGQPIESATIIEFKRPDRDDYTFDDNPISQLLDNLDELRSGRAKSSSGIRLNGKLDRYYCYAICTITPSLEKVILRQDSLKKSPEGYGYFGYYGNYNAYVEVIDYQKLLSNAKKRNKAFFVKLGLPIS